MQAATIATAGAPGHGKTALVRALGGTTAAPDPAGSDGADAAAADGATLDLGFAVYDLGGRRIGMVDLPGNERLVRGLLGDVHGMDVVLLVVAADLGVKPQTEECVDILHALAARRVVPVVTRTDLADDAAVTAVKDAVRALLEGTRFASAEVHTVSSVTGDGVDALRREIVAATASRTEAPNDGWFRMWVDRSFVSPVRGLTVTGTPISGSVRTGAALALRPGGVAAEAGTIQVHGETVSSAHAGQRIAIQLTKIDRKHVRRGAVLADPRVAFATDRFDCWIELRPAARRPLRSFDRIEIDLGTVETAGSVVMIDGDEIAACGSGYAQIALERDVIVVSGDRFVLRPDGGARTTGGGVVLHPFAVRHASGATGVTDALARLREPALPPCVLAFFQLLPEVAAPLPYVAQGLGRPLEDVRRAAGGLPELIALPGTSDPQAYALRDKWERLRAAVVEALTRYHRAHPLEVGMEPEALRSRLRVPVPPRLLEPVVERLIADGVIARDEATLRLPQHRAAAPTPRSQKFERPEPVERPSFVPVSSDPHDRVREALVAGEFTPPDVRQLEGRLELTTPRLKEILTTLQREGAITAIAPDLYFEAGALERARDQLATFLAERGEITVAEYRTLLDASRKYALALLEHFDREGVTERVGDARRLRA